MYQELNLNEGASLSEIKAAYRQVAKSCHPDSSSGATDALKFSRAHDAYKGLLKEVMGALEGKLNVVKGPEDASGTPYVFIGQRTFGLDIYYDVLLARPETGVEVKLNLPWTRREACPRCLGQGVTLTRKGNGYVYKPHNCERCQGKGVIENQSRVEVKLTSQMLENGKVRLRNAGAYAPKDGKRGDLIVNLEFCDSLPQDN
jgi:DnaJ-class molecular chaperone